MQLKPTLTGLISLAATNVLAATWNDHLQLWDIGHVKSDPYHPSSPTFEAGDCGEVPEEGWACGSYESKGVVALRAIYQCFEGQLGLDQVCNEPWIGNWGSRYNRCVKNQRDKDGPPLVPGMPAEMAVCVEKSVAESG